MPSDSKYVQSMTNKVADAILDIRAIVYDLQEVLVAYDRLSPSTSGTAIEGHEHALRAKLTELSTLATDPLLSAIVAAKVPSHRNQF